MQLVVGADHAGYLLKEEMLRRLREAGHSVLDVGTHSTAAVDYPDYAQAIAQTIQAGKAERGILVCGSGVGASIAANKCRGIRAALCEESFSARQGVEDDDANVLCLGARVIGTELAWELVRVFLDAKFSHAERHERRVAKVKALEAGL